MKPSRVEHYLTWVDREIDRVLSVEPQWQLPDFPVEERLGLRAEWDDVIDRYLAVVDAYDAGDLPCELLPRLVNVSERLGVIAPALDRMRLRRADPDVVARVAFAVAP